MSGMTSRRGLGGEAPAAARARAAITTPPPKALIHTPSNTYFLPTSNRAYTFNPLEKNPNLIYFPEGLNYQQYLKDVQAYQDVAKRAASPVRFGSGMQGGINNVYYQAESLLADLRKKYPNIGQPSEEAILRATPNVVAQVEQPAPALVRSQATGSGGLSTISARRRGGRGGLATIQGQATGLNPISSI